MGKIPPLTTLKVEDFEADQRKWLPRLFTPLNAFLTAASNVINGRIEFGSNIPAQDVALKFTHNGSAQRFRWTTPALSPKVLWVGQAWEGTEGIAVVPVWQYDASTQTVSVEFLKLPSSELTVGVEYQIFLRVVP